MSTTDTSEKGLESLIVTEMTSRGWIAGSWQDYDREYAVDLVQLTEVLTATQKDIAEALELTVDGPTRRKFLARLQGEIAKHGIVHVLRHGLKHEKYDISLFSPTPSVGNAKAAERFAANRFDASSTNRFATRSSNSPKSARPSDMPNTPATCGSSLRAARKSSSRPSRSFLSSWMKLARRIALESSRSSSTRHIPVRAERLQRP